MTLTPKQADAFWNVPMDMVDVGMLDDISTWVPDPSLPKEKRMAVVLDTLKSPVCFRAGQMGIKLEFDDDAPPIQEVLADFLLRKKSGL